MTAGREFVTATTGVLGAATFGTGAWALSAPTSFAEFAGFDVHVHFLRDAGAFQLGLGAGLLLALLWADALATVLAGFLLATTVHTVNHAVDLDVGGSPWQAWSLGAASVLVAAALAVRLRALGFVVGAVPAATVPELAPFARQKTVALTTYRRDGTPGRTPVSIAVDGDRAYVRSFERSLKTRRLRRDPKAEIAPCTGRGGPLPGPAVPAGARLLAGAEDRNAARMLRRKYPVLHGVVVPLGHRVLRSRTGRTVHFELTVTGGR
ncbi:PPOX class probable F420-dependent enzyme, Rv2061 family [Amycolatopsis arida]|uniref:PPOX class probable F420-dependent enzyme, Rv2061 family n=1 Tax=Amycolatopsis arida TaxID=587909 RepID=A0A1I5XJ36_9PSEU|nr:PPOX class F420-dependent oxidoreductase [Amycolatopsis arida]TDX97415.1 PPOX class probable F420-dependent enzyme [Amycolatopsis arida]SFQ31964.1 PPOX class probable F420-dependent enzyme, Rv2061 family [Amycolatopsis arida]